MSTPGQEGVKGVGRGSGFWSDGMIIKPKAVVEVGGGRGRGGGDMGNGGDGGGGGSGELWRW